MNIKFFEKESSVTSSTVYLAYLIMKKIDSKREYREKMSLFKLIKLFKTNNQNYHPNQFMFALMFLYMCGIIDFSEPYITINHA